MSVDFGQWLINLVPSATRALILVISCRRAQSLILSCRRLHLLWLLFVELIYKIVVHWRLFHPYFVSNILHLNLFFVLVKKLI